MDSKLVTGDAGVVIPKNQQKDDPLVIATISSILKVMTLQCPLALEWTIRAINQSAVSDVIAQTWHKNRENSDIFCCFWCDADGSARKFYRFMVGEYAPATVQKQTNRLKAKQTPTGSHWDFRSKCKVEI